MCKSSIDKKHFDFHHPKVDIKGYVKCFFDEKKYLLNDYYSIHKAIPVEIAKIEENSKAYQEAQRDAKKLEDYISSKIEQNKQEMAAIQSQIDKLTAAGEELVFYRSEHVNISAAWLSASKVISYDDLPFDTEALEEKFDENRVTKEEIAYYPKKGIYKAKFTVSNVKKLGKSSAIGAGIGVVVAIATAGIAGPLGGLVTKTMLGAGIGSAYKFFGSQKAGVMVNFYVKQKHIDGKKDKQDKLAQKKTKLKEQIEQLSGEFAKIFLEQQYKIFPQQIKTLQTKKEKLKAKLEEQYLFIDFIGEVYPLLYLVDDFLNNFAKDFKDQFKLFDKPKENSINIAHENEEKCDDDKNDIVPSENQNDM